MWVLRNLHSSGAVVVLKFMTLMFPQFKRELKLHPAHTSTCSTVYEPFVVSVRLIILINITSNICVCVRVCFIHCISFVCGDLPVDGYLVALESLSTFAPTILPLSQFYAFRSHLFTPYFEPY